MSPFWLRVDGRNDKPLTPLLEVLSVVTFS